MKKIIVGITGASGSILAHRFIENLLTLGHEVHLVVSSNGEAVLAYELEQGMDQLLLGYQALPGQLYHYTNQDLFAPIASGSFRTDAMVIIPCSMGTLSRIAQGTSDTLMTRATDVMLKEGRRLILVPRESPLSSIHLRNMLRLSHMGVTIMPPMPSFYNKPKTLEDSINHSVGRLLDALDIENPLHREWGENHD